MTDFDAGELEIRVHGDANLPTLVYLPGLHGDWTLIASFRAAVAGRARFVEFTYPRTRTWSLEDYARAIETVLLANGISHGWLLAESFGSQVAWWLGRAPPAPAPVRQDEGRSVDLRPPGMGRAAGGGKRFGVDGLILAGGFVRYPARWRVFVARSLCRCAPLGALRMFLRCYAWFARFRHRQAPETRAAIAEFVARRTDPDRWAIVHRLSCVANSDPRAMARETRVPVFHLAGLLDPVVPGLRARRWLRRHCPGFREGKTIWYADHNVLSTAPRPAADQILSWVARAGPRPPG